MSTAPIVRRRSILPSPGSQCSVGEDFSESAAVLRKRLSRWSPKVEPAELLWGLPPQCEVAAAKKLVAQLTSNSVTAKRRQQVQLLAANWLGHSEIDAAAAWEGVALLEAIPGNTALLDDATLPGLLQRWTELAALAAKDAWEDDPVRFQLLAVEGGLLLADWSDKPRWSAHALRCWQELAQGWLDEQGLPGGRYLPAMRPVLASWTRCLQRQPEWLSEVQTSFVGLLRQMLRLMDAQGREAFSCRPDTAFLSCLTAAVGLCDDREAKTLLQLTLEHAPRLAKNVAGCSPAAYSEAQRVGILRSSLSACSPRVTVAFDEPTCRLELSTEQSLLMGDWAAELQVDGQRVTSCGMWEEVCWYEDADVQYLEIETLLGDWKLQRHVLLARKEGFVLLSDSVLGPHPASLSYSSSLPLGPAVQFQSQRETHEGCLMADGRRHLVLPIALPEWRSDRPSGALSQSNGRLSLTTNVRSGRGLFHPLFISLAGSRRLPEFTWRCLTVAEQLVSLPLDAAAAFRVQIGDRQWVVYRGLTRGNRTFLGKNLTSEFFAGVLHATGQMDAIMEVE